MNHLVEEALRSEFLRFRLKYTCGDCVHSRCSEADSPAGCALGYDTTPHRERSLEVGSTLVFCKHFELW